MSNVFRVSLLRIVLSGLCLTLAASPAQAQLGRLKKMGADAMKKAAEDKLAGKKDTATATSAAGGNATAASRPAATSADMSLTDDRIALVLASLQPLVADAQKRKQLFAERRALAQAIQEHDARVKASQACAEKATKAYNPMSMASMSQKTLDELERMGKQSEAAQQRLNAARERNDTRATLFLQDTVNVLLQRNAYVTIGAKCTVDFTPPIIIEAQVAAAERAGQPSTVSSSDLDSESFDPPAAAKDELSRQQFGVIRERIALWALQQEDPTLKVGKQGVFTPEEQAALTANAAEIKKLTPFFKDSSMRWSTWTDLKAW